MGFQQTYQFTQDNQKLNYALIVGLAGMMAANIGLDYLFTKFRNSAFYISESLLFSALFWGLFFPLLLVIEKLIERKVNIRWKLVTVLSVFIFHLFAYPALVWVFSKVFFYASFSYWQTFSFSLSTYFITAAIIYFGWFVFLSKRRRVKQTVIMDAGTLEEKISSIIVAESNNTKQVLEVRDVLYFSANPPYVNIHHLSKKYLHTDTLKSLETQLNSKEFVRIHKSYIVNLSKIASIQSRQNGDYDITLSDESILRLSRSYAKNFKLRFSEQHQLTAR